MIKSCRIISGYTEDEIPMCTDNFIYMFENSKRVYFEAEEKPILDSSNTKPIEEIEINVSITQFSSERQKLELNFCR